MLSYLVVAYGRVRGAGFYGEFIDNRGWAGYMAAGYADAARALTRWRPARR